MKVAKVFVNKFNGSITLKGFADVVFALNADDADGSFTIKGFRILQNKEGELWVANPSQKGKDDTYYDTIIFKKDSEIATKFRNYISEAVLKVYNSSEAPKPKKTEPKSTENFDEDEFGF